MCSRIEGEGEENTPDFIQITAHFCKLRTMTTTYLRSCRVMSPVGGREAAARDPFSFSRRCRFVLLAPGLAESKPRSSMEAASSSARVKVLSDTHVASARGGSIRAGREQKGGWIARETSSKGFGGRLHNRRGY